MLPPFLLRSTAVLSASAAFALPLRASDSDSPFRIQESVMLEESYDSNVFFQSQTAMADRGSWTTSISPQFSLSRSTASEHKLTLGYTPTWTRFHSASSEDHVAHRLTGSGQVELGVFSGSLAGNAAWVDGSNEGIIWAGEGGAAATGAPALRDRRDQAVYRVSLLTTWKVDNWHIRPLASVYAADFQTVQRATPGYLNYVDRSDASVGLDLVRTVGEVRLGGSYRYGRQDQARLLAYPEEYDNAYHRALAIIEGKLRPWLTATILAGPEFRHYGERTPESMGDHDVVNTYVESSLAAAVTADDTLTVSARQFEMLSSSGRGAFEDLNLDLTWRHAFSRSTSASVTLHAYNTDFLAPAVRDDWVYTARIAVSGALTERWKIDLALAHDQGRSQVPGTTGRDFDRSVFTSAIRCTF